MRSSAGIAGCLAAACAALLAPPLAAKGPVRPVTGSVCGAVRCVPASGFSLEVAGEAEFHRHVAPAPFYVVRINARDNAYLVGLSRPIVYVPRREVWRVTIDGTPVWLGVPSIDRAVLRKATARLRPHPPPRTWRAVA